MNLAQRHLLVLLIIGQFAFGQDWVKTDIQGFATIDFPVVSDSVDNTGETLYAASDDDAAYVVNIRELSPEQTSQIGDEQITDLYEGIVQGAMDAANGTLEYKKEVDVDGNPGLEVDYLVAVDEELSRLRYKRIVYVEPYVVQIDFWPLTGRQGITNRNKERFFNSFAFKTILGETTEATKSITDDPISNATEIGYYVGVLIFVLMILGLLVGLVALFFYLRRRRKRNRPKTKAAAPTKPKITKVVCEKCQTENVSNSKYCKQCGYAL